MEKLKMHTQDKTQENIAQIAALFPNAVTETIKDGKVVQAIDFDILRQELSDVVVEGPVERYQFTWPDKRKSILLANAPIAKTLRPCREESVDFDTTENLYIEGDNLDALKLLQETYLGKVKMIYIDPPYNTGNDYVYEDNFAQSTEDYKMGSGQLDKEGGRLVHNMESNGRFHTDWLNMMYPRLKLAKDFLTEDGVIFVHIDDNEFYNLKKILDEIFHESHFINTITIKTKVAGVSGSYMGKSLQNNAEYILMYCKNIEKFIINTPPTKKQELISFIDSMAANNKSWKYTSVLVEVDNGEFVKSIKAGNGDEIKIYAHNNFKFSSISSIAKEKFGGDFKKAYYHYIDKVFRTTNAQSSIRTRVIEETKDISSELISIVYIPTKGKNAGEITRLYYKDDVRNLIAFLKEVVVQDKTGIFKTENKGNIWDDINYNNLANEAGISFPNGQKPIQLILDLISMFSNEESIIMDFFSGSSTTAHAVMKNNLDESSRNKFIMIQLPEKIEKKTEAYKAGYRNICEIGKTRICYVGNKIKSEAGEKAKDLDIGFRVLKVDSTNMQDVYYSPAGYQQSELLALANNIKPDRSAEDLLFQVMLDLGILLSSPIKETQIGDKKVFDVADGYLLACFDNEVNEDTVTEIARQKPYYAIFRDSSIANDSVAANFEQIFATHSPSTVRKVL